MNIAQAKCIPISAYLERQGISPKKTRQAGRELWYNSPIRQDDANPSFKVDTVKNLWFDHGVATGGNIIDLVRELRTSPNEKVIVKIDGSALIPAESEFAISRWFASAFHVTGPVSRASAWVEAQMTPNASDSRCWLLSTTFCWLNVAMPRSIRSRESSCRIELESISRSSMSTLP